MLKATTYGTLASIIAACRGIKIEKKPQKRLMKCHTSKRMTIFRRLDFRHKRMYARLRISNSKFISKFTFSQEEQVPIIHRSKLLRRTA